MRVLVMRLWCAVDNDCGVRLKLVMEDLDLHDLIASIFPDGPSLFDSLPFPTDDLKNTIASTKVAYRMRAMSCGYST